MVTGEKTQYAWHIHASHRGDRGLVAVEVGPRVGGLMNWRFAIPRNAEPQVWGVAQSGNRPALPPKRAPIEGKKALLGSQEVLLYGAADRLSEGLSAYVVFRKEAMPAFVAFGVEDIVARSGTCNMERITFVASSEETGAGGMSPAEGTPAAAPADEPQSAAEGQSAEETERAAAEAALPGGGRPLA